MSSLNASLIVNPVAGNRLFSPLQKIETLLKQRVSLTTLTTQKKGDALAFAKDMPDTDIIIVAGGDGTFNEVINGMLKSEKAATSNIPLALIPLGTSNVLAKELCISTNIKKAVHQALTGTPKKISLGKINDRYFALMAGIGFDGETVFKVKNSLKKTLGKGAYILSGFKVLAGHNPSFFEIKTSAQEIFKGYTAVVGKSRHYAGSFLVTPGANPVEPLLDLCLFQGRTRMDFLRFIFGVITKKHLNFKDIIYRKVSGLEITSPDNIHVQIDGDYFGTLPVKIGVLKNAISVIY